MKKKSSVWWQRFWNFLSWQKNLFFQVGNPIQNWLGRGPPHPQVSQSTQVSLKRKGTRDILPGAFPMPILIKTRLFFVFFFFFFFSPSMLRSQLFLLFPFLGFSFSWKFGSKGLWAWAKIQSTKFVLTFVHQIWNRKRPTIIIYGFGNLRCSLTQPFGWIGSRG